MALKIPPVYTSFALRAHQRAERVTLRYPMFLEEAVLACADKAGMGGARPAVVKQCPDERESVSEGAFTGGSLEALRAALLETFSPEWEVQPSTVKFSGPGLENMFTYFLAPKGKSWPQR